MLTEDQFYELAKIIDNDFIGSDKTFTARRKQGYNYLSTNRCDEASCIKVYHDFESIYSITRLSDDTDGWQDLHLITIKRVKDYLNLISVKNSL